MADCEELKELAVKLFNIGGLKFGEFETKVGFKTPFYLDLRSIVAHPKLYVQISKKLLTLLDTNNYAHFCGVPYTALPIASIICAETNVPMILRRKEIKPYGTKKMLEGRYQPGDKVVIVDDVIMSGASVLETIRDLKAEGLDATTILAIVDREQGGVKNLEDAGLKVKYIFTICQMMGYLLEAGKVTEEQVKIVKEYVSQAQISPEAAKNAMVRVMATKDELEELALELYESEAVVLGNSAKKLGDDKRAPVYIDLNTATTLPGLIARMGKFMEPLLQDINHDLLCGISDTESIPICCNCRKDKVKVIFTKRDDDPSQERIIGEYEPGSKVIVVEGTLLGDGVETLNTVKCLQNNGLKVLATLVGIDEGLGGRQKLEDAGITVRSLFTLEKFVELLLGANKVTKETAKQVNDYVKAQGKEDSKGLLDSCRII